MLCCGLLPLALLRHLRVQHVQPAVLLHLCLLR
jgi:hypothetical protein